VPVLAKVDLTRPDQLIAGHRRTAIQSDRLAGCRLSTGMLRPHSP
jgi:hypothetical protein